MKLFREIANLQRHFATHPLTCAAPLGAWYRFAKWQMRSRLQEEILFDWIGGRKLAVQHGMAGATQNIYVGLHEFFDMMLPLHFLRQNDLFLDIGANVGTYTVLASGVCRATTYAFEPDPETQSKLRRNVEINQIEEYVQVFECALGPRSGTTAFTIGLDTNNRIATANDTATRTVRMEALDKIVYDLNPAMMKIDVEGAGLEVLSGAEHTLVNPSLKIIELEYPSAECIRILSSNGFEIGCYDPFHRTLNRDVSSCRSSNALFVRDWPFVTDRLLRARPVEILGRTI